MVSFKFWSDKKFSLLFYRFSLQICVPDNILLITKYSIIVPKLRINFIS